MRRSRRTTVAAGLAGLLAAPVAAAHDTPGGRAGYVSSVTEIRPNVLGLQASVLGSADRLFVRNWSGKTVVILGADGTPLLRFDRSGVSRSRGAGTWSRVSAGTGYAWHDHRIGWYDARPPAAVEREPAASHLVRRWRIAGTVAGRPFVIRGLLGYSPPTGAGAGRSTLGRAGRGAAIALVVAVAGGLLALGARRASRSRAA